MALTEEQTNSGNFPIKEGEPTHFRVLIPELTDEDSDKVKSWYKKRFPQKLGKIYTVETVFENLYEELNSQTVLRDMLLLIGRLDLAKKLKKATGQGNLKSQTEHEDQTQQGLSVIKNAELHSPSTSDDEDADGAQKLNVGQQCTQPEFSEEKENAYQYSDVTTHLSRKAFYEMQWNWNKTFSEMKAQQEQQQEKMQEMEHRINKLSEENKQYRQQLCETTKKCEQQQEKMQEMEHRINKLSEENTQLCETTKQCEQQQEKMQEMERRINKLSDEKTQHRQQLCETTKKCEQQQEKMQEMEHRIDELSDENTQYRQQVCETTEKLEQQQEKMQEMESRINELSDEKKQHQQQLCETTKKCEQQQEKMQEMEHRINELSDEKTQHQQQLCETTKKCEQQQEEMQEMESRINELSDEKKQHQQQLCETTEKCEQQQEKMQEVEHRINELSVENTQYRQQVCEATEKLEQQQEKMQEMAQQLSYMETQCQELHRQAEEQQESLIRAEEAQINTETYLNEQMAHIAILEASFIRDNLNAVAGNFQVGNVNNEGNGQAIDDIAAHLFLQAADEGLEGGHPTPPDVIENLERAQGNDEEMFCSICQEGVVWDEEQPPDVRVLPSCRHTFHFHCIRDWLCRSNFCPNCRATVE